MAFNIEFQMQVKFTSSGDFKAWKEKVLIQQRAQLELLPSFSENFDEFDEDLLTDLIIEDTSTLEEALDQLRSVGYEIAAEDIVEWRQAVDDEGTPGVHLLEARKLRRDSQVSALLDHLRVNPAPDLLEVNRLSLSDHGDIVVNGSFRDYDAFCDYRLPLIFAGASAKECDGSGHVSFFGVEDMTPVSLFFDFDRDGIAINEPDVQDAMEWNLHERFESVELTDEGLRRTNPTARHPE
ncbi:hypothetical protein [Streptomyces sp. NPDC048639]|uniref:hypothetical protein n=1 Tax=Streptomyces sp. NPDC048639 TaxID=3365581 RepID=UPI00371BD6E7